MGLDMYLSKKTYVKNWDFKKDTERYTVTARLNGRVISHIKKDRVSYVIEEVMYWRKSNAIHQWFVDNCADGVDNCQPSYVSRDELEELAVLCKQTADYIETCPIKEEESGVNIFNQEYHYIAYDVNPEEIDLRTQSGFFFGSTEYTNYMVQDLRETAKVLTEELNASPKDGSVSYEYRASW